MGNQKVHYRKAFNSPYLSSADIVEPTVLTISKVALELDKTKKTKDFFNTAYFKEKQIREGEELKPMILNAGNSRTMKGLANSPYLDDWKDIPVTIYVDQKVRFGRDFVEGLRISTEKPITQKPDLQPGTSAWDRAIIAYRRDKNFSAIEKHMHITADLKARLVSESEVEEATE